MRRARMTELVVVAAGWLAVVGCRGGGQDGAAEDSTAESRTAIQATLEEYLPAFAEAYGSGNLEPLRQWTVERELSGLQRRVTRLLEEGLALEPELVEVTVESVEVWSHSNAYATTLEVWNLRYYSTGAHVLFDEQLGTRQRVKYQLKLEDGRWRILYREVSEMLE